MDGRRDHECGQRFGEVGSQCGGFGCGPGAGHGVANQTLPASVGAGHDDGASIWGERVQAFRQGDGNPVASEQDEAQHVEGPFAGVLQVVHGQFQEGGG